MARRQDGYEQLTIRLDPELRHALNRKASELDRSVGWLVRDAVYAYLGLKK